MHPKENIVINQTGHLHVVESEVTFFHFAVLHCPTFTVNMECSYNEKKNHLDGNSVRWEEYEIMKKKGLYF